MRWLAFDSWVRLVGILTWVWHCLLATQHAAAAPEILAVPAAVRLEGVGNVYGLGAAALKWTADDRINLFVGKSFGASDAIGLGLSDIPLFERWSLAMGLVSMARLDRVTSYQRGVGADSRYLQELSGRGGGLQLRYHSRDQSLTFDFGIYQSSVDIEGFETPAGEPILLPGAQLFTQHSLHLAPSLSYAMVDNAEQPTSGFRVQIGVLTASGRTGQSDQMMINYGGVGYVPVTASIHIAGRIAFSDSVMIKSNSRYDEASEVEQALAIDCTGLQGQTQADCLALKKNLVEYITVNNQKGLAKPLGGSNSLRAFREQRFKAAHTRLASLELRWDISKTWPDWAASHHNRWRVLLVPFYDLGAASDQQAQVYDAYRSSYGLSLRLKLEQLAIRLSRGWSQDGAAWFFTVGTPF